MLTLFIGYVAFLLTPALELKTKSVNFLLFFYVFFSLYYVLFERSGFSNRIFEKTN